MPVQLQMLMVIGWLVCLRVLVRTPLPDPNKSCVFDRLWAVARIALMARVPTPEPILASTLVATPLLMFKWFRALTPLSGFDNHVCHRLLLSSLVF